MLSVITGKQGSKRQRGKEDVVKQTEDKKRNVRKKRTSYSRHSQNNERGSLITEEVRSKTITSNDNNEGN